MNSNAEIKELKRLLLLKQKQVTELHVLIDTMQSNLRSCIHYLDEEQEKAVGTRSLQWCLQWRAGDELK